MKLLQTFKKLNKLYRKKLSGKNAALFLLNRKIPNLAGGKKAFGTITDLHLDRQNKTTSFEITRDNEVNTITVRGYRIVAYKGASYLNWTAMDFDGPARETYRQAFRGFERLEVPRAYIFMLEAVL